MMNLKKLKGWKRLWFRASRVWLMLLAFFAWVAINGVTGRTIPTAVELGVVALIFVVTSGGLYLLGLGVEWVWQGLKLKGESESESA